MLANFTGRHLVGPLHQAQWVGLQHGSYGWLMSTCWCWPACCMLLQAHLVCYRAGYVDGGDERRNLPTLHHSLSGQRQRVVQLAAACSSAKVSRTPKHIGAGI